MRTCHSFSPLLLTVQQSASLTQCHDEIHNHNHTYMYMHKIGAHMTPTWK